MSMDCNAMQVQRSLYAPENMTSVNFERPGEHGRLRVHFDSFCRVAAMIALPALLNIASIE